MCMFSRKVVEKMIQFSTLGVVFERKMDLVGTFRRSKLKMSCL